MNKKVLLVLTDGFEEIEALGTYALLKRSNIDVDIYGLNKDSFIGRYGIKLSSYPILDESLDVSNYDLLFIAGGPEYQELEQSNKFKDLILKFNSLNKYIAAICAGPTILGHLGLLNNKDYTCFKSMDEKEFNGNYKYQYVIKDQNIISAISASATIDFAFMIIETLLDKEYSSKIKASIYYDAK